MLTLCQSFRQNPRQNPGSVGKPCSPEVMQNQPPPSHQQTPAQGRPQLPPCPGPAASAAAAGVQQVPGTLCRCHSGAAPEGWAACCPAAAPAAVQGSGMSAEGGVGMQGSPSHINTPSHTSTHPHTHQYHPTTHLHPPPPSLLRPPPTQLACPQGFRPGAPPPTPTPHTPASAAPCPLPPPSLH